MNPLDTMQNPYPQVKEILNLLYFKRNFVGFRVLTDEGKVGDVSHEAVNIKIFKALKGIKPLTLKAHGELIMSEEEHRTGKLAYEFTYSDEVVQSLQYAIYLLERKYRQNTATDIFEVAFGFHTRTNEPTKYLSGYIQANNEEDAVNFGRSYIAQTETNVNIMDVQCIYIKPFYGEVEWGKLSPLLAIKLTLESKWNRFILPKAEKEAQQGYSSEDNNQEVNNREKPKE